MLQYAVCCVLYVVSWAIIFVSPWCLTRLVKVLVWQVARVGENRPAVPIADPQHCCDSILPLPGTGQISVMVTIVNVIRQLFSPMKDTTTFSFPSAWTWIDDVLILCKEEWNLIQNGTSKSKRYRSSLSVKRNNGKCHPWCTSEENRIAPAPLQVTKDRYRWTIILFHKSHYFALDLSLIRTILSWYITHQLQIWWWNWLWANSVEAIGFRRFRIATSDNWTKCCFVRSPVKKLILAHPLHSNNVDELPLRAKSLCLRDKSFPIHWGVFLSSSS